MSADLNTFIEMEGTKKELKAMIMVIKDYCGHNHDAELNHTKIGTTKKFDGKNDVPLETLTSKGIDELLVARKKKVYISAGGPYGRYGRVDEAGIFKAIAEAAPSAKFKARTVGYTTGQQNDLIGELKKGKLYITYSCLADECISLDDENGPSDEDWYTEKSAYDPIKKEYERKYSVEEYVNSMLERMPLAQFRSLFGLSKVEVSGEEYHNYIQECYCSYQFPRMGYIDFKYFFPDAEIDEEEFDQNVEKAIEEYDLVSYESFGL